MVPGDSVSTYPTSATLAAFRRSIHNRTSNHGLYEPCITDDTYPSVWPGERSDGIGYRSTYYGMAADIARREASAMRSRAARP